MEFSMLMAFFLFYIDIGIFCIVLALHFKVSRLIADNVSLAKTLKQVEEKLSTPVSDKLN